MGWELFGGIVALALIAVLATILWMMFLASRNKPGEDRKYWATNHWSPRVKFSGQTANVENIRNLSLEQWRGAATLPVDPAHPSPYHLSNSYNLQDCTRIWLFFSPYHGWISFEFAPADGGTTPTYLVLSVEARFHYHGAPPSGRWTYLTSVYDVFWSLSTESDLLYRCMAQDKFPYPILLFPVTDLEAERSDEERGEARRKMLRTALEKAHALAEKPENYNYMNNSCATNTLRLGNLALGRHDNKPAYIDGLRMALRYGETGMIRLCYEANLIDDSLVPGETFDEVCEYGNVTDQLLELAKQGVTGDELSYRLRERYRDIDAA